MQQTLSEIVHDFSRLACGQGSELLVDIEASFNHIVDHATIATFATMEKRVVVVFDFDSVILDLPESTFCLSFGLGLSGAMNMSTTLVRSGGVIVIVSDNTLWIWSYPHEGAC